MATGGKWENATGGCFAANSMQLRLNLRGKQTNHLTCTLKFSADMISPPSLNLNLFKNYKVIQARQIQNMNDTIATMMGKKYLY